MFVVHTGGLHIIIFSQGNYKINAQNVAISHKALVCLSIIVHLVSVFVVVLQCKQLGLALGDLERE